jgi:hypothetical protein
VIAPIHLGAAVAAAGLSAGVLVAVLIGAAGRPMPRRLVDRLILLVEAGVAIAIATGLFQLASGERPDDLLHFLYAVVALGALPAARAWRGIASGPRVLPVSLAALVVIALMVRLAQTG